MRSAQFWSGDDQRDHEHLAPLLPLLASFVKREALPRLCIAERQRDVS
jgi:hypothetical protein